MDQIQKGQYLVYLAVKTLNTDQFTSRPYQLSVDILPPVKNPWLTTADLSSQRNFNTSNRLHTFDLSSFNLHLYCRTCWHGYTVISSTSIMNTSLILVCEKWSATTLEPLVLRTVGLVIPAFLLLPVDEDFVLLRFATLDILSHSLMIRIKGSTGV